VRARKEHSTSKAIEGELNPGDRVAVIEDIITTAAQSIRAANAIVAAGARVVGIFAVVDREDGGSENIACAGYGYEPLFRLSDLPI
jgi:orotate phosphoribosyltransferase